MPRLIGCGARPFPSAAHQTPPSDEINEATAPSPGLVEPFLLRRPSPGPPTGPVHPSAPPAAPPVTLTGWSPPSAVVPTTGSLRDAQRDRERAVVAFIPPTRRFVASAVGIRAPLRPPSGSGRCCGGHWCTPGVSSSWLAGQAHLRSCREAVEPRCDVSSWQRHRGRPARTVRSRCSVVFPGSGCRAVRVGCVVLRVWCGVVVVVGGGFVGVRLVEWGVVSGGRRVRLSSGSMCRGWVCACEPPSGRGVGGGRGGMCGVVGRRVGCWRRDDCVLAALAWYVAAGKLQVRRGCYGLRLGLRDGVWRPRVMIRGAFVLCC